MKANPPIESYQGSLDPGIIDLGVGHPQDKFLPLARLRQAAQARLSGEERYFLQYGSRRGDSSLRTSLAEFLSQHYPTPVEPEQLFITNGVSIGLALVCSLFSKPGDVILVEEPTYFLGLKIFADYHLKAVPVPIDEHGLILDTLVEKIKAHKPSLLYTIPTFQNPSGVTLSEERRGRLAELSREHDFLIVADEVYHFLNYSINPPPPMASYIDLGNVLSLGSFSKILAPGLRTGWIQADERHIQRLIDSGLLESSGGLNPFTSAIIQNVIASGDLLANIQELRQTYTARLTAMDTALRHELPQAGYKTPQGGYFFWLHLPMVADTRVLLKNAAAEHKVLFTPGASFSCRPGLEQYLRLCFAYYDTPQLEEGVRRLANAILKNGLHPHETA